MHAGLLDVLHDPADHHVLAIGQRVDIEAGSAQDGRGIWVGSLEETREANRFRVANRHNLAVNDKLNKVWSLFSPTVSFLTELGLLVIYVFGIWQVFFIMKHMIKDEPVEAMDESEVEQETIKKHVRKPAAKQ